MSPSDRTNIVRFRPRTPEPPKPPRRPSGLLPVLLVVVVLGAIWAISQYGEKLGLPSSAVNTVQTIRRNISPQLVTPPAEQMPMTADFSCRVEYVNDGDTLRCTDGTRVRLHAVSARETNETCSQGHPCPTATAAASTAALRKLVQGKTLDCQTTGQSYNRVTAICWTPNRTEVNCAMIESGNAALWPRFHRETPICRATPNVL